MNLTKLILPTRIIIPHNGEIYTQDISLHWHSEKGQYITEELSQELDQLVYISPTATVVDLGLFTLMVPIEQVDKAHSLLAELLKKLQEAPEP